MAASSWHLTAAEAVAALPHSEAAGPWRFASVLQHGSLRVGLYAPQGRDPQGPHGQDEVYVVLSGWGEFVSGDERVAFGPGDVLFVPAGREHRFDAFSEDFQTWAIFYGPQGGEAAEVTRI